MLTVTLIPVESFILILTYITTTNTIHMSIIRMNRDSVLRLREAQCISC